MSAARSAANRPRSVPQPEPIDEREPEGPEAGSPETETPQAETPQAETPQTETPQAETPQAEVPGVGTATRPNAWAAPMNALGGFIRGQRQLAKLSLRDMATMTSVSNAYLSQVERGLHQPSLKVLHSIADALELSTEQLLTQAGWATHGAHGAHGATPAASSNGGGSSTEEAIRTDPRLSAEQRTALLGVYRSFVDGSA